MGVALIVMIIAFGAVLAAFVPIITAIVGLSAATMLIMVGASRRDHPSFTTFLASMIGIALSIDYALFIVSRYKHELRVCATPEEAAGRAVGTAGSAVVFAGATVIIALTGLSIVGVEFLTFMGLGGATPRRLRRDRRADPDAGAARRVRPVPVQAEGALRRQVRPEDDTHATVGAGSPGSSRRLRR